VPNTVGSPIRLAKGDLGAGWRDPKNRPGGVNGNGGLSLARREAACYRQSVFHGRRSEVTNEGCARLGSGGCRSARPSATGSSRKPGAPILAARSDLANASKETAHDELPVPGSPAVPLVAEEPAPSARRGQRGTATAQTPERGADCGEMVPAGVSSDGSRPSSRGRR
jgi:hypothetical protein